MKISAVLIVKDEEEKITECLASLDFCDEIIIVDSGSADSTKEIAAQYTQKVYIRSFDNYANQKNYAVELASNEWVLSIDADERVSPALKEYLTGCLKDTGICGYRIKRKNIIFGRMMKHGGNAADFPLRLFQKQSGKFSGQIHEVWVCDGKTDVIQAPLIHLSTATIGQYLKKLIQYTRFEALQMQKNTASGPAVLKSFGRFFQRYFIQLGLLDGFAGLIFAVMSGYYEFLKNMIYIHSVSDSKK